VFTFPGYKRDAIITTLRFHLAPVRMAIFKDNNNNKCWHGCGKTRTLIHCWWERKLVKPTIESNMETPQKTRDKSAI
jgi:hypothetical protein